MFAHSSLKLHWQVLAKGDTSEMEVLPATAASLATLRIICLMSFAVQKLCFWRWWQCHVGGHLGHHRSCPLSLVQWLLLVDSHSKIAVCRVQTSSPQTLSKAILADLNQLETMTTVTTSHLRIIAVADVEDHYLGSVDVPKVEKRSKVSTTPVSLIFCPSSTWNRSLTLDNCILRHTCTCSVLYSSNVV